MLNALNSYFNYESLAALDAMRRTQAVAEFKLDGTILDANQTFLTVFGYTLNEIKGRNHRIFVNSGDNDANEDQDLWTQLRAGQFQTIECKRIAKDGRELWVQSSYAPVFGRGGRPVRIVEITHDVTEAKMLGVERAGLAQALGRAHYVMEFALDGTLLDANDVALHVLGYTLTEVRGKPHALFVDPRERHGAAYKAFWSDLRAGRPLSAEFKRITKDGKPVWLQATYNPILDLNGKPFKVIKVATDVTARKVQDANVAAQIAAIGKSQAIAEFDLQGHIIDANANFLKTLGYEREELIGRPHSMLVESEESESPAYRQFWVQLNQGIYQSGEYHRIGKGGRSVWIQASYNPILDLDGVPIKIVKLASDVTAQVIARKQSEHLNGMLEDVAAGAEDMSTSVNQISEAMEKSRDTVNAAYAKAEAADKVTRRLHEAAQSMGGIASIINAFTAQINLLALNATIESARAGEAGRGFSVVANEVKNLANKTRESTDRIVAEIVGMRAVSNEVVTNLDAIKEAIEEVRQYVSATTTAVQEQSAAADFISSSVQMAALEAKSMNAPRLAGRS